MTNKIIYPVDHDRKRKVVFLAGPIKGTWDWQSLAARRIDSKWDDRCDLVIANPRTPDEWHGDYEGQVSWETQWLKTASKEGVIMFWLAKETEHTCTRSYAQTSRFELGEWFGKSEVDAFSKKRIIVGIERGFSNERYIRRRFAYGIHVYETLEDTCQEVVNALHSIHI